jgi:serine/threonine-protein kinase
MGVVYHAIDPSIGRPVAIKTIHIADPGDTRRREKLRERLFTEARSAGVLSHPHIVTIYDIDEEGGDAWIAMAWVNGPTLETVLSGPEPLSGARMLGILRQTAIALDYAHTKGIVHRDVKPANIMTDEDGSVKITDFGIARITATASANNTQTVVGTPNYMSPEQVQGLECDGRADQFSLAVIAWEILTGERPFTGDNLSSIVYKIVHDEPPPARQINPTLTPRIDEVLRKALAKDPAGRFPNCASFVGALEMACAESRGWQALAPGAAAAMPTVAVEMPVPLELPSITPRPKATASRLLPVLMSATLVAAGAAMFLYESGLIGPAAPTVAMAPPRVEPPTQTPPQSEPQAAPQNEPPTQPEYQKPSPLDEPSGASNSKSEPPPQVVDAPAPRIAPAASQPAPRTTNLWVSSEPSGANVVLDDNPGLSCASPCMLHAAPGTHHVTLTLAGYLTEYRELHVGAEPLDVPLITMQQPTGTLLLSTIPAGATIRINGQLTQQRTPASLPLKPGTYTVTVEKDGMSHSERVEIREAPFYLRIPLNR